MENFILGIFFMAVVLPIVENILSIINQKTEYFCTKIAVDTYNLKQILEQNDIPEAASAIGFHIDDEEIDDDIEEE